MAGLISCHEGPKGPRENPVTRITFWVRRNYLGGGSYQWLRHQPVLRNRNTFRNRRSGILKKYDAPVRLRMITLHNRGARRFVSGI